MKSLPKVKFVSDGLYDGEFMGNRLVVSLDKKIARHQTEKRLGQIREVEELCEEFVATLKKQESGTASFGCPIKREDAISKIKNSIKSKGFSRIVNLTEGDSSIGVEIKEAERKKVEGCDGKMEVPTNVQDMPAEDVLNHCRERADIEQGFRTLKSDLSINPVHHRLPD